jgi:hypothetical protein
MIAGGIVGRAIFREATGFAEGQNLVVQTLTAFTGRLEELGAYFGGDGL